MILSISLTGCGFFPYISYFRPSNPQSVSSSTELESPSVEETPGFTRNTSIYNYYDVNKSQGFPSLTSTGDVNLLVIPVVIKGYENNATEVNWSKIEKAFNGNPSETSWESVKSFYDKSSFGNLNLDATVTDWYECGLTPSQLAAKGYSDGQGGTYDGGTWYLLRQAVEWYKKTYSTKGTEFDIDKDGYIDAVWLIYSAPNYSNNSAMDSNFWAYVYYDQSGTRPNKDNPTPFLYGWASYDFMQEGYGKNGIDAHTYIHETGHLLGLDDYYDYDRKRSPTGGIDMMDANIIDHNSFSKYALDWINPIVAKESGTIRLKPADVNGDALIIAPTHSSAFDEYIMIDYYRPEGLNKKDSQSAYANGYRGFTINGVRIYHVDARIGYFKSNSSTSFTFTNSIGNKECYVGQSNTPSYAYSDDAFSLINLIERDKTASLLSSGRSYASDNDLFKLNDSFSIETYPKNFTKYKLNSGATLDAVIKITEITSEYVEIKVTL